MTEFKCNLFTRLKWRVFPVISVRSLASAVDTISKSASEEASSVSFEFSSERATDTSRLCIKSDYRNHR